MYVMYVLMHACIQIFVYVYVCLNLCIYVCMQIYVHVCAVKYVWILNFPVMDFMRIRCARSLCDFLHVSTRSSTVANIS